MKERLLIAGIGNIFLGDDAFGVEVVRALAGRFPPAVRVVDFGIRGFDLAYALMDGCEFSIIVDATPRGGCPGTLYTIEPELPSQVTPKENSLQGHNLTPHHVFELVPVLGGSLPSILIVGCEPTPLAGDEEQLGRMSLSPPVQAAVPEAVKIIDSLVADFFGRVESESKLPLVSPTLSKGLKFRSTQKGGSV